MAEEPDSRRLRALESRLSKVTGRTEPAGKHGVSGFSQGEIAWRMVIELVVGMVIGMGIGYGLDVLFGTLPVLLIIFALLGFAAGIKTMLRTASEMRAEVASGQSDEEERG